jgi:hypothetical protein
VVAVRLYQLHRKIGQPVFEKQCRQCNHHRTKSESARELRSIFRHGVLGVDERMRPARRERLVRPLAPNSE